MGKRGAVVKTVKMKSFDAQTLIDFLSPETNIDLIVPKAQSIMRIADRFAAVVSLLVTILSKPDRWDRPADGEHLSAWLTGVRAEHAGARPGGAEPETEQEFIGVNMFGVEKPSGWMSEDRKKAYAEQFEKLKDSPLVAAALKAHEVLNKPTYGLASIDIGRDEDEDDESFKLRQKEAKAEATRKLQLALTRTATAKCTPFADFDVAPLAREFKLSNNAGATDTLVSMLHKAWGLGKEMYDAMLVPDIDAENFVIVLHEAMGPLKAAMGGQCNEAIDMILKSMDRLRNNMGSYYKTYALAGGDAVAMISDYVQDVSENEVSASGPRINAQFKKIIAHFTKAGAQFKGDSQLQELLKMVNKSFDGLSANEDEAATSDTAE